MAAVNALPHAQAGRILNGSHSYLRAIPSQKILIRSRQTFTSLEEEHRASLTFQLLWQSLLHMPSISQIFLGCKFSGSYVRSFSRPMARRAPASASTASIHFIPETIKKEAKLRAYNVFKATDV